MRTLLISLSALFALTAQAQDKELNLTPELTPFQSLDSRIRDLSDTGLVCTINGKDYAATHADESRCRAKNGVLGPNRGYKKQALALPGRLKKVAPSPSNNPESQRYQNINPDGSTLMPRNYDPSEPGVEGN